MTCRCPATAELWDDAARDYADNHLQKVAALEGGWVTLLMCPEAGVWWVKDYPRSEEHGGGPVRLRRADPEEVARRHETT